MVDYVDEEDNEQDVDLGYDQDPEEEDLFEDMSEDTLNLLELFDPEYDEGMFEEEDEDYDEFSLDLFFDIDDDISAQNAAENTTDVRSLFTPVLKSKAVNYEGVSSKIKNYLSSLPTELRDKLVVTSGKDGTHAKNSKHYSGNAVDLRYDEGLHSYVQQTAKNYGLKTMNPFHGTAPHTHLEAMQFGGSTMNINPLQPNLTPQQYKPNFDIDYLNEKFNNDVQTVMDQGAKSLTPKMGGVTAGLNAASDISNGISKAQDLKKQINQAIFDTTNSAMDSAISILGEQQRNQELRRISKMRAESSQRYQSYTPQIKNIPIYT